MNLKKVLSAALSAAICAGALSGTAVTAGASNANVTTAYDLSAHTTAASTTAQDVTISSEFKVHLNGSSDTAKADSISNGEINFYRAADSGTSTPTGYIVFTPANSGTLALNLKSSNNAKNNGARLYAKAVTNIDTDLSSCTKNGNTDGVMAQGATVSSAGTASDYLEQSVNVKSNSTDFTFTGGQTYILYPYTYNREATLSFKDFTYTYTADISGATDYSPESYIGTDKGCTVTFSNVSELNSKSVKWYAKKNDGNYKLIKAENLSGTTFSDNGSAVFGLVITGDTENKLSGVTYGAVIE